MSLLWLDGFDAYNIGTANPPPTSGNQYDATNIMLSSGYVAANDCMVTTETRTGRGCALRFRADSGGAESQGWFRKVVDIRDELVVGFAFKYVATQLDLLCRFEYDNLYGTRSTAMAVYINGTGGLTVSVGGQPIAYSPSNIIFPNVWHYVEVKYKPRAAGGRIVVRVDGVTFINFTGKTKPDSLPEFVNVLWVGQTSNDYFNSSDIAVYQWIDDLYILDTQGDLFNDFLGDVVIHSMMPTKDAGPNQGNQFGGGLAKFTAIDEIGPDDDQSYIYANTVGVKEMFGIDPLPSNVIDVLAVGINVRAKKDAAGVSNYSICCKVDDTEEQSDHLTAPTQYVTRQFILETKPGGGSWTKEDVEAMSFGFELK